MRNDAHNNDNYGLLIRHPKLAGRWASGDQLRNHKPRCEQEKTNSREDAGEETFRCKLVVVSMKKKPVTEAAGVDQTIAGRMLLAGRLK